MMAGWNTDRDSQVRLLHQEQVNFGKGLSHGQHTKFLTDPDITSVSWNLSCMNFHALCLFRTGCNCCRVPELSTLGRSPGDLSPSQTVWNTSRFHLVPHGKVAVFSESLDSGSGASKNSSGYSSTIPWMTPPKRVVLNSGSSEIREEMFLEKCACAFWAMALMMLCSQRTRLNDLWRGAGQHWIVKVLLQAEEFTNSDFDIFWSWWIREWNGAWMTKEHVVPGSPINGLYLWHFVQAPSSRHFENSFFWPEKVTLIWYLSVPFRFPMRHFFLGQAFPVVPVLRPMWTRRGDVAFQRWGGEALTRKNTKQKTEHV